jgi:hypothetical protein
MDYLTGLLSARLVIDQLAIGPLLIEPLAY